MTARVEITANTIGPALRRTIEALSDDGRQLMLEDMGEYLVRSTRERAARQVAPDGTAWQPLSPRYKRAKERKRPGVPMLKYDFHMLGDRFFSQVEGRDLLVGSTAPQAAIMHFGGTIKREARQADLYYQQDREGTVGNRFVPRRQSNFVQRATIPAYTITMPARPWLGLSREDEIEVLAIAEQHLLDAASG